MSIRYHDTNVGVTLGGGGGGTEFDIHEIGSFGGNGLNAATSVTVTVDGFGGTVALIAVVHRDTITAPSGCTLLDSTLYAYSSGNQWISVFKASITSNSETFTFNQASSVRIGATAWVLDRDFTLTKKSTDYFQYYLSKLSVYTDYLAFVVFQSYNAQTTTSKMSYAVSDGGWICQGRPVEYQLRHFSGIIYPTQSTKETKIWQDVYSGGSTTTSEGQVVVYQIS